jgi:hypothetical protein
MNSVVIHGNTVTVDIENIVNVSAFAIDFGLTAFAVMTSEGKCEISFPMTADHHRIFAAQIHRHNNEQKLAKKGNKGNNTDPDGDGPKPTNPRGGGGSTVEFEETIAIAA